jgi:hypothetical protein
LGGALVAVAAGAHADPYRLTYTGTFNTSESLNLASAPGRTFFSASTPFTITAFFDNSSPNLLPPAFPFLGFVAYVPTSATIQIGGTTYNIETAATNATAGVTVSIFDRTPDLQPGSLRHRPDRQRAGRRCRHRRRFLRRIARVHRQCADADGPFTEYYGVGHGSGPCISGNPPACPHLDVPWVLRDAANVAWNLTLGNYEEDYPALHPGSGVTVVGPLNTAVITAVPEPATLGLMLAGLAGVGTMVRRRHGKG